MTTNFDKTYPVKMREFQLQAWPHLKELERRWSRYSWLPLDLPRFDYPDASEWIYQNCKPIVKLRPDISNPAYGDASRHVFNAVDVLTGDKKDIENIRRNTTFSLNRHQEFIDLFPELYERILFEFPVKKIKRIMFWSSVYEIPFHRDETEFIDSPCSFRIMLDDTNPSSTLRLLDAPVSLNNPRPFHLAKATEGVFSVPRIDTTNTMAWNNFRVLHGSVFQEGYRKIIMIIESGVGNIDVQRYHKLMERSVKKYEQHAMISNRPQSDYII